MTTRKMKKLLTSFLINIENFKKEEEEKKKRDVEK